MPPSIYTLVDNEHFYYQFNKKTGVVRKYLYSIEGFLSEGYFLEDGEDILVELFCVGFYR